MSAAAKASAEQARAMPVIEDYAIPLHLIRREGYFAVRGPELVADHVKALGARLRNIGELDPVLLWQSDGGLVLLDGAHRLAAYREAKRDRIPARIVHCDRREALLLAVQANSKVTLAMSNADRWNLAWRLVQETDRAGAALFSKRQIIEATGASKGTIDNMRATLASFLRSGRKPSGNWIMDRAQNASGDWTEMSDEEAARMVEELAKELRKALNVRGVRNEQVLALALQKAVGDHRLREWVEYLYAEDEESSAELEDGTTDF